MWHFLELEVISATLYAVIVITWSHVLDVNISNYPNSDVLQCFKLKEIHEGTDMIII